MLLEVYKVIHTIIIGMIMGVGVIKIGDYQFGKETTVTLKIIFIVLMYGIFLSLNYIMIDNLLKVVFIYMCIYVIYRLNYKDSVAKMAVNVLICYLIITASEILVFLILGRIFSILKIGSILQVQNTITINLIITIISMYIAYRLKEKLEMIGAKVGQGTTKLAIIIIVIVLITIAALLINVSVSKFEFNYIFVISIILTVGLSSIGIITIKQNSTANVVRQKYDSLMEYSKSTEKLMEKYRKNLHEQKNRLTIIKSMIGDTNKEVTTFINSTLEINKEKQDFYWISELKNLPFTGLKGFMNHKITEMRELGLEVNILISHELEKIKEEEIKEKTKIGFYKIIGILLDNAREAASESEEKKIVINAYKEDNKIIFEIANTYIGEIDLEKIQESGYSSKGKNRGNGLSILHDELRENLLISNQTEIQDIYFIQKLIIEN